MAARVHKFSLYVVVPEDAPHDMDAIDALDEWVDQFAPIFAGEEDKEVPLERMEPYTYQFNYEGAQVIDVDLAKLDEDDWYDAIANKVHWRDERLKRKD